MQVITIESEAYKNLIAGIDMLKNEIAGMKKGKDMENEWLDGKQVLKIMKISERTLQSYREQNIIPYYKFGQKILYKLSDIQQHLEKNYIEARKRR